MTRMQFETIDGKTFLTVDEAKDHEASLLAPCKVCGDRGVITLIEPNREHSGSMRIECEDCKTSVFCEGRDVKGDLEVLTKRCLNRWEFLMRCDDGSA